MGNWHMSVQGVGAHHNKDYDADADKLFHEFVKELRRRGHNVQQATFMHGAAEDMAGDERKSLQY